MAISLSFSLSIFNRDDVVCDLSADRDLDRWFFTGGERDLWRRLDRLRDRDCLDAWRDLRGRDGDWRDRDVVPRLWCDSRDSNLSDSFDFDRWSLDLQQQFHLHRYTVQWNMSTSSQFTQQLKSFLFGEWHSEWVSKQSFNVPLDTL